jgi:hypothetical protein
VKGTTVLNELSTEPIAIGGNGYTIRLADHVRLIDENGRVTSPQWLVTAIMTVPPTSYLYGYTALAVRTADPSVPALSQVDQVEARWAIPVGTPLRFIL